MGKFNRDNGIYYSSSKYRMDELLSSFQELGEILLEHLLDVEEIIVNYELMMEEENMEIMNDLYVFFWLSCF